MKTLRIRWVAAVVASTLAVAANAHADPPSDPPDPAPPDVDHSAQPGFQAGARVGYTDGLGVIYQGLNLSDASSGALPIMIDLGWRIVPEFYLGVYGQFAPVFLKTYALTCQVGWSCHAQDWRFGIEGDYHFLPHVRLDPYVGLGVGYEVLHSTLRGPTLVPEGTSVVPAIYQQSLIDRGWEYASLTIGFDWRFCRAFGAGLFLLGTVGAYDVQTGTVVVTAGNQQQSQSAAPIQTATHELAFIGIRGTFNL